MRTFTDAAGRTWHLHLTVAAIGRVRSLAGVDLVKQNVLEIVTTAVADPVTLCNVLYAALEPEATKSGVTPEQFGEAMRGDVIDQAAKVFLDELSDFTPNPRDRARVKTLLAAMIKAAEESQTAADAATERLAQAIATEMQRVVSGRTSGGSPALPELTPPPSPGGS